MAPSGASSSEYRRIIGSDDDPKGSSVIDFITRHGQKIWWIIVVIAVVIATAFLIHAYGRPVTPSSTLRTGELTKDAQSLYAVTFPIPDLRDKKAQEKLKLMADQGNSNVLTSSAQEQKLAKSTMDEALKAADVAQNGRLAIEEKLRSTGFTVSPESATAKHHAFMVRSEEAEKLAAAGYKMVEASKYVAHKLKLTKAQAKEGIGKAEEGAGGCVMPANASVCVALNSATNTYHSTDSICNNINNPGWGSTAQPYRRILLPAYDDGISTPRSKGIDGTPLPHPRKVSTILHSDVQSNDEIASLLMPMFGQFIDHDITATAIGDPEKARLSCCKGTQVAPMLHPECIPFSIKEGDELYQQDGERCFNLWRSSPYPSCKLGPRNQFSDTTSIIDGSTIYGHTDDKLHSLRVVQTEVHGYMTTFSTPDGRKLLPVSTNLADGCNSPEHSEKGEFCFASGDERLNENIALTSMHLLWVRHHNKVADQLAALNPAGHDGKAFFETREIIIAQLQHVTYNEFLPVLLGPQLMEQANLTLLKEGYYKGYDETVDPTVSNVFAAAAFRMGHAAMQGSVKLIDKLGNVKEELPLHQLFYNPFRLWQPGNFDAILRGLSSESSAQVDNHFTTELTRHMFESINGANGLDLAAINVQRGRDHGLPGYAAWRTACGLEPVTDFDDLMGLWRDDALYLARQIYKSPEDVDPYTGMLAEKRVPGAMVGPTIACVLADQFVRIRRGDRFWYESDQLRGRPIPPDQLQEIRKITLARIICDASDGIKEIQMRPLEKPSIDNPIVPCNSAKIPTLDYTLWYNNVNTGLLPD